MASLQMQFSAICVCRKDRRAPQCHLQELEGRAHRALNLQFTYIRSTKFMDNNDSHLDLKHNQIIRFSEGSQICVPQNSFVLEHVCWSVLQSVCDMWWLLNKRQLCQLPGLQCKLQLRVCLRCVENCSRPEVISTITESQRNLGRQTDKQTNRHPIY